MPFLLLIWEDYCQKNFVSLVPMWNKTECRRPPNWAFSLSALREEWAHLICSRSKPETRTRREEKKVRTKRKRPKPGERCRYKFILRSVFMGPQIQMVYRRTIMTLLFYVGESRRYQISIGTRVSWISIELNSVAYKFVEVSVALWSILNNGRSD